MIINGSPDILSGPASVHQTLGSFWSVSGIYAKNDLIKAIKDRFYVDIDVLLKFFFDNQNLTTGQRATALQQIKNYYNLDYNEIGLLVGMDQYDVFNFLSLADQPIRQGSIIIVQPTNNNLGIIVRPQVAGSWKEWAVAYIPVGSDPIDTALSAGGGTGTNFLVTTTTGVTANAYFEPLSYVPSIPFNSAIYGAIKSIWSNSNLSTRQKVKAVWALVEPYNTSIDELEHIFAESPLNAIFNMRFSDDTTAQPIVEAVIAAPAYSADAALNVEFSNVFNNTSLTMDQKATAWQYLMKSNSLSVEDVSRITGIDSTTIANFLLPTAIVQEALHPVVTTAPKEEIIMIESPSYIYATQANGIGLNAFYNNILSFLDTNPTNAQLEAAKREWSVSDVDINNALLYRKQHPVIVQAVDVIDNQIIAGEKPVITVSDAVSAVSEQAAASNPQAVENYNQIVSEQAAASNTQAVEVFSPNIDSLMPYDGKFMEQQPIVVSSPVFSVPVDKQNLVNSDIKTSSKTEVTAKPTISPVIFAAIAAALFNV